MLIQQNIIVWFGSYYLHQYAIAVVQPTVLKCQQTISALVLYLNQMQMLSSCAEIKNENHQNASQIDHMYLFIHYYLAHFYKFSYKTKKKKCITIVKCKFCSSFYMTDIHTNTVCNMHSRQVDMGQTFH